jgi:hypothetical protein
MFRYCIGVLKSLALAGRLVLGDLPVHLKLSSNSNHVTCMIINCSLHGYIRTCRLHIGIFFVFLLSLRLAICVSNILEIPFYKYVILFMPMLDTLYHAFLWEI